MDKWPKRFLGEKMMGIMQAWEEGRVHIPPTPGSWLATHLFWAFRVKVALEKRERKGELLKRKLDCGESSLKADVWGIPIKGLLFIYLHDRKVM